MMGNELIIYFHLKKIRRNIFMALQYLLNAILLGGIYALMGIGFSLQWGISRIMNLSYGGMVVLGSYISLEFFNLFHLDPFISMIITSVIFFVIGAAIYGTILYPLTKSLIIFTIVLTFAIKLIIENVILKVWSADYRTIRLTYAGSNFQFGDAYIPLIKFLAFFVAAVLIYLTYLFMMNTKTGKGIQAVVLDQEGAQVVGIDVRKMYLINFALGTALAGLSGSIWAIIYVFSPHLVGLLLGKVIIITILGGLGNIWGAAAGGLLLGIAETSGVVFLGSEWQEAIGLVILLIVLLWRPYGLLGKKFFG
jgi:branched-chain amino acid transport system permease protein